MALSPAHEAHIGEYLGTLLGMVLKKYISLNKYHTSLEIIGKKAF